MEPSMAINNTTQQQQHQEQYQGHIYMAPSCDIDTRKLKNWQHKDVLNNCTNRSMKQVNNSDKNPAMLALSDYQNILDQIQYSNLNFQIQLSPSSALISLKKSFVKDRNGDILIPPVENPILSAEVENLVEKNGQLEKDILSLTKCYE